MKEAFLKLLKEYCPQKKVLDYGCGNGYYSKLVRKMGAEVIGIDLLPAKGFIKMDCEDMTFPNNTFDVVFSRGTLPYLNKDRAFMEIARVLKPGGIFIGLETLGHNPLANLYRRVS